MEQSGLHEHVQYALENLDLDAGGPDANKRRIALKVEKYADHIFARPISAQFLTRNYHLLWLPVDLGTVEFSLTRAECPTVVHAPSNPQTKGTGYVLQTVGRLRREGYKFDFKLCQNRSNTEVRRMLANSEIAVDQLILPSYGLFAVEAMASGNAVIGSAVPGYNGFPEDMPVFTTTPETIYQNLRTLLDDHRLRTELAIRGRKWVERYHDYRIVTKDFIDAFEKPSD
jgi:hypothetical protein